MKMEKRVKYLVCDSGAFIKAASVQDYAEHVYTVRGAVSEIKDKATLQRLQVLPYILQIKEPSPEALNYVTEFAKKTGDYGNLSAVDLQIIALTYQLEKENVGTQHLNSQPICQVTGKPAFTDTLNGFYIPKEKTKDINKKTDLETNNSVCNEKIESEEEEEEEEDDDDEGWITPANIAQVQKEMEGLCLDESVITACVTTDFCIQNVLLQIGLHVISVDGMLIKETRIFILRCYSCFKTTNDVGKKFCSNCGNKTLKRVAVTVHDDGSKNIHINFRKPIPIRGTRYSLPLPKGGKHSMDPLVCEDQPIPQNRLAKKATQKVDVMNEDYIALSSPFALNDVYSRSAQLGLRKNNQYLRRNPNEWSKRTGRRK